MITKTSVFCQKMPEKTVVKDAYSPKKIEKAEVWDKKQTFINQVEIFKLNFISSPLTKMESDQEFPKTFETPHTFDFSVICNGVIANQNIES